VGIDEYMGETRIPDREHVAARECWEEEGEEKGQDTDGNWVESEGVLAGMGFETAVGVVLEREMGGRPVTCFSAVL
jgi:hypothetical protein